MDVAVQSPLQDADADAHSNSPAAAAAAIAARPHDDTTPKVQPHSAPTPPRARSRRRSSAAKAPVEGPGAARDRDRDGDRDHAGSTSAGASQHQHQHQLPNWAQSLLPHKEAAAIPHQHQHHGAAHAAALPAVNGSASPARAHPSYSPSRSSSAAAPSARSPTASPQRRRPRSPQPPAPVTALPQLPTLQGPILSGPLLSAAVYDPRNDPRTPDFALQTGSPSTADLFTPNGNSSTDYFSSRPHARPSSSVQRAPSRSKADRVLGRSPLGSPPLGVLESEARYRSASANRPTTATANAREGVQRPAHSGGRDSRASEKGQDSRNRSESNTSSRPDDSYQDQDAPPRSRERREKDKKTMLSRALQKANTAVLLDNAQNVEGAIEAYGDACKLLQQVMMRSSGNEDRRKLDAIRVTYTNRIEDLKRQAPGYHSSGKSLPARPMSNESLDEQRSMLLRNIDDEPVIETATMTRIINDQSVDEEPPASHRLLLRTPEQTGSVRDSIISTAIREVERTIPVASSFLLQPPPGRIANGLPPLGTPGLESPMDRSYMPPPLSPRRPLSPISSLKQETEPPAPKTLLPPDQPHQPAHKRGNSSESISWLDTIDESGGSSCSSSVHSQSPGGLRRKHLRNASGATEAEFDAALDAAVEAAYDEGYEPYEDQVSFNNEAPNSAEIAARLRNVELAKERVREAEREEVISAAKYRYAESQARNQALPHVRESAEFNFQDEAEEEERLLDEMTREYMLDGFDFDLQTKSSLPRQSDSSGFSGATYHSSVSSHRTTGGTSLSTVNEVAYPPQQKAPTHSPPPVPSPPAPLPSVMESQSSQSDESSQTTPRPISIVKDLVTVRSRRLSGTNVRTLKIETSLPPVPPAPHTERASGTEKEPHPEVPPMPKSATDATAFGSMQISTDVPSRLPALPQLSQPPSLSAPTSQPPAPSPVDTTFTISPATPAVSHPITNDSAFVPSSPKTSRGPSLGIRKNKSSLSLKQRTLSISSPDGSDGSIGTPLSTTFSFTATRKQSNTSAPAPTPSVPTFNVDGLPSGGMHLFESDIHTPYSPGSPGGAITNAPIPLEPCPDSYLLRPFWLMRCFYQTIAHPRGGYLSTKLFVPRDVWRVKGVKIKNIDDKIANCDFLTAALQRLGTVDTLDADAVLEEMQALELVLDQVQIQLAKKLGNEVGVHSVSALFKDATSVGAGASSGDGEQKGSHGSQDHAPKSAVGKSYLSSWKKLRSKNSAVGLDKLAAAHHGKGTGNTVPKDSLTMPTLPMTSLPNIRFAKRDVASVVFEGPNSGYMGSLARLFDAVQILDQIARQVEDPGLKHSSPTHVGLELSARHAAEFFGFYICRFVLTDVTLMLEKFIKRGSEWVLV